MHNVVAKRLLFLIVLWLLCQSAGVSASQLLLKQFFTEISTLQANFEQRVVDETGMLLEFSSGKLTLSRPGQFRWDYADLDNDSVRGQQIIADGESLLMYDPDLEQVTQRSMQNALAQVPSLMLVQGGKEIQKHFQITDIGLTDGLSWVSLKPLAEDAGFQHMMIGFSSDQLDTIVLLDGLGNETRLSLSSLIVNKVLARDVFKLEVPDGTDLLIE